MSCSLEALRGTDDPGEGIRLLVETLKESADIFDLPGTEVLDRDFGRHVFAFRRALSAYCESLDRPLVVFFDEADSLPGKILLSMLSQLRIGYTYREEKPFPHSVALVGMRDLKDYRYSPNDPESTVGNTSPFNIVSTLVLRDFTPGEVAELYGQHTADTCQPFTQQAVDLAFSMTQGQPWLVNAIGDLTVKATASDPGAPVTEQMVSDAAQSLILSREVHISSLEDRLREPRIQRVLAPLITGGFIEDRLGDDYKYIMDLGLIRDDGDRVRFANPIYAEVILRIMTFNMQARFRNEYPGMVLSRFISDGQVLVDDLLTEFVGFWRENSEMWSKRWEYQESAPHIVMQAFMQRIVNGGAILTRECAEGNGRLDLAITPGDRKYPIELKIHRDGDTLDEAVEQILGCMDRTGAQKGWAMVFDQSRTRAWEEKVWIRTIEAQGKTVMIYRADANQRNSGFRPVRTPWNAGMPRFPFPPPKLPGRGCQLAVCGTVHISGASRAKTLTRDPMGGILNSCKMK